MYTLLLLGYTHMQSALTTRFYGKCPVCDLKTESYSLSRIFITQTNCSRGLKTVKYFCKHACTHARTVCLILMETVKCLENEAIDEKMFQTKVVWSEWRYIMTKLI